MRVVIDDGGKRRLGGCYLCAEGRTGYKAGLRHSTERLTKTLIVDEEESAIADYGTANVSAKLIQMKTWMDVVLIGESASK